MNIHIVDSVKDEWVDCLVGGIAMHVVLQESGDIDFYLGHNKISYPLDDVDYTEHMDTICNWLAINMPFVEEL